MHRFLFLSLSVPLAVAGCAAGPTTGDTFTGTTANTTKGFFGWTDMKSKPVTAYAQTKPYCPIPSGTTGWTAIGSSTTASTPTSGMNDASHPAYYYSFTSNAISANQWKQGGVARFKVRSPYYGSATASDLLGFTTDGPGCAYSEITAGSSWIAAGNDCQSPYPHNELIHVVSTTPTPTEQHFGDIPFLGMGGGNYFNGPALPGAHQSETDNYYLSIGARPTLGDFKDHYGFASGDIRAVYYNEGDLGIARDMHCRTTAIGGGTTTACYVSNFGRITHFPFGPAGFGSDPQTALDQALAPPGAPSFSPNVPLATVAMVSDSTKPAADRVQFMVYDEQGNLTDLAPLDNPGLEAFKHQAVATSANLTVPTNCLTCHGPSASYAPATSGTSIVHGARFLPYDPENFIYSTNNATWSKANTLPKLKQLNALVWDTGMTPATQELMRGMYPSASNTGPKDAASTFDPTFIPTGWQTSEASRLLYTSVVKPYCRTCHVAEDAAYLDWNTAQEFSDSAGTIGAYVCNQNHTMPMPMAEHVQTRMWSSGARAHLLAALQLTGACASTEDAPANPGCQ